MGEWGQWIIQGGALVLVAWIVRHVFTVLIPRQQADFTATLNNITREHREGINGLRGSVDSLAEKIEGCPIHEDL